jgi:hypothetical protein
MLIPNIFAGAPSPARTANALQPGQILRVIVQGSSEGLAIRVAGQRIPLGSAGAEFAAGQTVRAEVVATGNNTFALRLTPEPTPASASAPGPATPQSPPAATAPSLPGAAAALAEALGRASDSATLARMIPPEVRANDAAVRQLLNLFMSRGALGDEVRAMATLMAQAASAGVVPELTAAFVSAAGAFIQADAASLRGMLEKLTRGRGAEARIAEALAAGNVDEAMAELEASLRTLVGRLRGHDAVRAWMRGQGVLKAFEEMAQHVLERLDGAALQNLRGMQQPYVFLELPLPRESGFHHAQLHLFGDGPGKTFDQAHATFALDLSLSRLGDLWVLFRAAPGQCQCNIRAVAPAARDALQAGAAEFEEALARAGYPHVRVEVQPWDGDRLRAAASLMDRFARVDTRT